MYEMAVGRPPFKAQNHVELLKKIERGEDRIRFPDEKSSWNPSAPTEGGGPAPQPVGKPVKDLIRKLLKRNPVQRLGFEEFFRHDVSMEYAMSIRGGEERETAVEESAVLPNVPASMMATSSTPPEGRRTALHHQPSMSYPIPTPVRPAPSLPPFALPLPASPPVQSYVPSSSSGPSSLSSRLPSTPLPVPSSEPSSSRLPQTSQPSTPPPPSHTNAHQTTTQGARRYSFEPNYLVEDRPVSPMSKAPDDQLERTSMERRGSQSSARRVYPREIVQTDNQTQEQSRGSSSVSTPDPRGSHGPEGEEDSASEYVVIEKRTVEINSLADGSSCFFFFWGGRPWSMVYLLFLFGFRIGCGLPQTSNREPSSKFKKFTFSSDLCSYLGQQPSLWWISLLFPTL